MINHFEQINQEACIWGGSSELVRKIAAELRDGKPRTDSAVEEASALTNAVMLVEIKIELERLTSTIQHIFNTWAGFPK
jgi:hypothetical protein